MEVGELDSSENFVCPDTAGSRLCVVTFGPGIRLSFTSIIEKSVAPGCWTGLDGLAGYGSRFFSFLSFSFGGLFSILLLLLLLLSESETRFVSIINLHLMRVEIVIFNF